jgi:hypothetical protein
MNFHSKNVQICASDTTQTTRYWWNPRPAVMRPGNIINENLKTCEIFFPAKQYNFNG